MTTHAEWLSSRDADAPRELTDCVCALMGARPDWERLARPEAFILAAEQLLRRVLAGGAGARANALELLAADACVTWAFEAAADEPRTVPAFAERATKGIAAIAAEYA